METAPPFEPVDHTRAAQPSASSGADVQPCAPSIADMATAPPASVEPAAAMSELTHTSVFPASPLFSDTALSAQTLQSLTFGTDSGQVVPRKRLFIGLITGTSILLSLLLLIGWVIPYVGFGNMHAAIPYITGLVFFAMIGVVGWAALGLVVQIATGRPFWGGERIRGMAIKFFLPLMELLARLFGIAPDDVRRSFIKVNNQLALTHAGRVPAERLLVLLPHCLQQTACTLRLSHTVDICQRCGRCPLAGLLALRDAYGVRLAVATGGSIARRIVVEMQPQLILAVACERDLAAGIQDTHPLPVFGVLNARPEGPCRNTQVQLAQVEAAIRQFICKVAQ